MTKYTQTKLRNMKNQKSKKCLSMLYKIKNMMIMLKTKIEKLR